MESISFLNRNFVTSAIQDSPLSFLKPCSLSFGFRPTFVKYLQSTTNPNSDQMCAYTTLWHGHSSRQEHQHLRAPGQSFSCSVLTTLGGTEPHFTYLSSFGPREVKSFAQWPQRKKWEELGPSDSKASVFSTVLYYWPEGSREVLSSEFKNATRVW